MCNWTHLTQSLAVCISLLSTTIFSIIINDGLKVCVSLGFKRQRTYNVHPYCWLIACIGLCGVYLSTSERCYGHYLTPSSPGCDQTLYFMSFGRKPRMGKFLRRTTGAIAPPRTLLWSGCFFSLCTYQLIYWSVQTARQSSRWDRHYISDGFPISFLDVFN